MILEEFTFFKITGFNNLLQLTEPSLHTHYRKKEILFFLITLFKDFFSPPPPHWALMWHLARSGLSWFPISDYTLWFRTHDGTNQFLVKFWSIKKKEHFSSSKTGKVRAFLDKSLKFSIENLSKAKDKSLRLYKSYNDCL